MLIVQLCFFTCFLLIFFKCTPFFPIFYVLLKISVGIWPYRGHSFASGSPNANKLISTCVADALSF